MTSAALGTARSALHPTAPILMRTEQHTMAMTRNIEFGRLKYIPRAALTMPGLAWRQGQRATLGREFMGSRDSASRAGSLHLIESLMPLMDGEHLCVAHILQGLRQDALLTIGQRMAACVDSLALTPRPVTVRSSSCCDGGVVVLTSPWTARRAVRAALTEALRTDNEVNLVLSHLIDSRARQSRNRRALSALHAGLQPVVRRLLSHHAVYRFTDFTISEDTRALRSVFTLRFFESGSALAHQVHDAFQEAARQHHWLSVDCGLPGTREREADLVEGFEFDGLEVRTTRSGQEARRVITQILGDALGLARAEASVPACTKSLIPVWLTRRAAAWSGTR